MIKGFIHISLILIIELLGSFNNILRNLSLYKKLSSILISLNFTFFMLSFCYSYYN